MLSVYNSLSRKLEPFKPLQDGVVKMYHCGPTVYNFAHIGNLRSYVFADVLRRTAEYLGYKVEQVVNITDIGHLTSDADTGDDKMVKGLKREGLPLNLEGLKKLADKYEKLFKEDLKSLNIETPHHFPRATEYLDQEKKLIQILLDKDVAYKVEDGIYFDISKLESYGKLGGLTPQNESKARIEGTSKKNPRDFVLWKLSKNNHLGFPSPWGVGFPGWHIECSAMSREILGQPFDIHTGGIDHIPVHHNNEIAQSEAAYNEPLAKYWMHNEFVTFSDSKMAKSEGNAIGLREVIENGFSPLAYRYFLLLSHYRTPTNFSWEALGAAQNAYSRLKNGIAMIKESGTVNSDYEKQFRETIENDLNTPQAIAVLQKMLDDKNLTHADMKATALKFDRVLGLELDKLEKIPEEILQIFDKQKIAWKKKDYAESDKLRDELEKKGWKIQNADRDENSFISRI